MTTWREAHAVANMATAQARHAWNVAATSPRVDVVDAVRRAQVQLMWQPMPTIFGAYVNEPRSRPGILINSGLPVTAQRYTTAHELGHHWLRHTTSVDDGSTIDVSPSTLVLDQVLDEVPPRGVRRWTEQEKLAEAFAAWFMMPRATVLRALEVLGLDQPADAGDCYQLSLLLGTPYRSTVRHLQNLRLATPTQVATWSKVQPARLKAYLDRGVERPASRSRDVWQIGAGFTDLALDVRAGDRLVLTTSDLSAVDPPPGLRHLGHMLGASGGACVVLEVVTASEEGEQLTIFDREGSWSLRLQAGPERRGLDRGASW